MSVPFHLIVIGTSAGGMPALVRLVAQLPATLPAAVLVVQHFAANILFRSAAVAFGAHQTPARIFA